MDKETFAWLTLGFGVGLLVTAAVIYTQIQEDNRRHQDPRLGKAEALLDEAERLLNNARKSGASA